MTQESSKTSPAGSAPLRRARTGKARREERDERAGELRGRLPASRAGSPGEGGSVHAGAGADGLRVGLPDAARLPGRPGLSRHLRAETGHPALGGDRPPGGAWCSLTGRVRRLPQGALDDGGVREDLEGVGPCGPCIRFPAPGAGVEGALWVQRKGPRWFRAVPRGRESRANEENEINLVTPAGF